MPSRDLLNIVSIGIIGSLLGVTALDCGSITTPVMALSWLLMVRMLERVAVGTISLPRLTLGASHFVMAIVLSRCPGSNAEAQMVITVETSLPGV